MVEDRIGRRYAKSVFGLAQEKGMLDEVQADMALISSVITENRDLTSLLNSPIVNSGTKETILSQIFKGHLKGKLSSLLIDMLVRKGREMYLLHVANAFLELYDAHKGIARGVLTAAVEMDAAQVDRIKSELSKKTGLQFEITTEVDPDLIGGFTLKMGDNLFDGSVSGSLRRVKQAFQRNYYTVPEAL